MADNSNNDPLRSPITPSGHTNRPPLSPRAIQFADDPHLDRLSPHPSRNTSPTKAAREPSPDPLFRPRSSTTNTAANDMAKDYGAVTRDASNSTSASDANDARTGYRASGPGRINLPPSPYVGSGADQLTPGDDGPSRTRAASMSPSVASQARSGNPRRMSFKRRAPSVQQRQKLPSACLDGRFPSSQVLARW